MNRKMALIVALGMMLGCELFEGKESEAEAKKAEAEAKVAEAEAKKAEAEAKKAEAEAKKVEAEAKAAAAKAEADAKTAEAGAKTAGPKAAEVPEKVVAEETRKPVEPELGPMSRPEPDYRAMPAPPFAQTLKREAPVAQGPEPTLKKVKDERNKITDDEAWFRDNGLDMPTWDVPGRPPGAPGDLPPEIAATYKGIPIFDAIDDRGHTIALHGVAGRDIHHLVVRTRVGDVQGAFDFSAYGNTPGDDPAEAMFIGQEVRWAQVRGGVLFVSTNHRTYAKSSGGLNAFITAIDIASGDILWQSAPLVCNSVNFLVKDGWIVTGYGFTAEPDFMYVLNAKTGEVASKVKVKSGPSYILEKGGTIYVRTYDRNLEFELR